MITVRVMSDEKDKVSDSGSVVYKNLPDYIKALNNWLVQQRYLLAQYQLQQNFYWQLSVQASHQAMQKFQSEMRPFTNPTGSTGNQAQIPPPNNQQNGPVTPNNQQPLTEEQNANLPIQGRRYVIPSPWKRIMAEAIDYCILLVIKVALALLLNRDLSLRQLIENIDLDLRYISQSSAALAADMDNRGGDGGRAARRAIGNILGGGQGGGGNGGDLTAWDLMSVEIIVAEIINRIVVTLLEALFLHRGFGGRIGGATPGKLIMGLRVVSCSEIYDFPNRVEVVPGDNPGLLSAFIRSSVKNFGMIFFFPICMTTLFVQHHRPLYDMFANTVVVQEETVE